MAGGEGGVDEGVEAGKVGVRGELGGGDDDSCCGAQWFVEYVPNRGGQRSGVRAGRGRVGV